MDAERDFPAWIEAAAADLYDRIEQIDGEAMNDAQVAQDERAGRATWIHSVGRIIASHASKARADRRGDFSGGAE